MNLLKILRKLVKAEIPSIHGMNLNETEQKWFEIGFNSAKGRFEGLIDLLEKE